MKHLLEELWHVNPDEPFYNVFTRENKRGIQNMLVCKKEEIKELSCRVDDGSINNLLRHKVGNIRTLAHYQSHEIAKEFCPEDMTVFRFNYMSREDWDTFVNHPDSLRLISSTGDTAINPLANSGLSSNF